MKRRQFLKISSLALVSSTLKSCYNRTKKPNILFCIADDASFPHMGAYGCSWINTPAFDYVAKNGILFTQAFTPNAKCAPSRSCILTGRNSWQLEEAANHWCYFPKKFKTYAEALSENGYHVGYTAKGWAPGVAGEINGVKRQLTGKPYNEQKTTPPAKYINSNDYAENFKSFLDDKQTDTPFCFWYGSTEPHRRYEYGAGITKGGKKTSQIDRVFPFWPDNETVRTDMLDYAFEIEYFDQHLQKMINLLKEKGELDNTLLVVTADNGMPFPRIKGQEYEYSNHLPLAVMWPRGIKNPGRTVDDFISFIDFAPTFLELAELDAANAGMKPIQGKSLTDIFYSANEHNITPERDHVLIGKERHDVGRPNDQGYPIRGIFTREYLFIKNFNPERWPAGNPETGYLNCDGSPTKTVNLDAKDNPATEKFWQWNFGKRPEKELYNRKTDLDCMNNLATLPEYQNILDKLENQLVTELEQQNDPRILGNGHIFDQYEYADKSGAHFYERYMRGEDLNWGWVNDSDFRK